MKILALETSGEGGSVALMCDHEIRGVLLDSGPAQSASALERVGGLLAEAGCRVEDLDAVAFSAGPGAFTGLRLGCGLAQGLAMGAGIGVVPVGTLETLAAQVPDGNVVAAIDARMGELYWARFDCRDGVPRSLQEPACVSPANWSLPSIADCTGIGSAFKVHREALQREMLACFSAILDERMPAAAEVARLAARYLTGKPALDPAFAAPLYVRNKVAQTTVERLAQGGRA